jgi:hypothetical protein
MVTFYYEEEQFVAKWSVSSWILIQDTKRSAMDDAARRRCCLLSRPSVPQ